MSETINYGIDLGTSNSSIAKHDGKDIRIFKNRDQMDVTPSVVRIEKTGRKIVGRRAYQTILSDPENVVSEFKRWMGQSDRKKFQASGISMDAEELSAEVLKTLLEDARRQTSDPIDAAVITVPAAFGQLQCEATARSASLAGLISAPLIQEPVAASIAYGMKADSRDKRWLVYDLGGGTFDIAVVSTKDGRLTVMEHKGDNMLGGKEMDRAIVDKILLPCLQKSFKLHSADSPEHRKLIQILRLRAEEAKIDLGISDKTTINIYDVGVDISDTPIEMEITISKNEINNLVEPIIDRTISLCKEALQGARTSTNDIAAIVLVGGPTHMPIVREMLSNEFKVSLDFSIDPMTVVARGAAIYASTIPLIRESKPSSKTESVQIELAYETIWSELSCLVAGRLINVPKKLKKIEILIESEGGYWTSGWQPVNDNYFEINVQLIESQKTRFWIYLRDDKGKDCPVEPDSFSIRHGLTIAEPLIPHSIGIEVIGPEGKSEIDVIFPRSTPLPASKRITYKALKILNPGQTSDYLAVKIWEGEWLNDPDANTFVGVLKIDAQDIKRAIPEGAEIEISIEINASRLMDVQAFVPVLNQHFRERVYVAKENQESALDAVHKIKTNLESQFNRVQELEQIAEETQDTSMKNEVVTIREKLITLSEKQEKLESQTDKNPDDAKKLLQDSKDVRGRLSSLEKKINSHGKLSDLLRRIEVEKDRVEEIVNRWGQKIDQKELSILCKEADSQAEKEDERALQKIFNDLSSLKWRVLFKQDWYWKECFEYLSLPDTPFVNNKEAKRLIAIGQDQVHRGDGEPLRSTVRQLWDLQPKDTAEVEREMVLQAGIRRKV